MKALWVTIPACTNWRFDRPDTSRIANPSAKYHQPVVADMFVIGRIADRLMAGRVIA
jgi:hypothetical protein